MRAQRRLVVVMPPLLFPVLFAAGLTDRSQAQTVPCRMHDLEVTLQIAESPHDGYTLAVNFLNVSGRACTLNRAADEPSFFFKSSPPATLFTRCVALDGGLYYECAPSRDSVVGPGVTLEPGAVGHQAYSWKTEPAHPGGPCVTSQSMDNTVNQDRAPLGLVSTVLLKQICSPVLAGPYVSGRFPSGNDARTGDPQLVPAIQFMPDNDKYYLRERLPIRGVIDDSGGLLERLCPILLVRVRQPSGGTGFKQARPRPCKLEATGIPPLGATMAVEVELEGNELALGDNEIGLDAVAETRSRREVIITSPSFHLNIADPATIERKWGPHAEGVAVALALDKDRYELGWDIPLHIAMANLTAEDTIVGTYDPPIVEIELRDSCGRRIEPRPVIWSGHGSCGEYPRGKVVPNELSLKDMGLLPELPGSYTAVAIWRVSRGPICDLSSPPDITVRSIPATFRVVDEKHPVPEPNNPAKCADAPGRNPN